MSYISFTVTIPYWVPSSGFIAIWLIVGLMTLIWCAITTAGNRRRGYTPCIIKDTPLVGLLATFVLITAWPVVFYLRIREKCQ